MSLDRSVFSWKMLDLLGNNCELEGQWPLGSFCNLCDTAMPSLQQGPLWAPEKGVLEFSVKPLQLLLKVSWQVSPWVSLTASLLAVGTYLFISKENVSSGDWQVARLEKMLVTKLKDLSLINPWDPHGGTRELGITSCSLIFTHIP